MAMRLMRSARPSRDAPAKTQDNLLRSLLRQAGSTEWGRRFGFADLARAPDVVAAYQRRVPLHDYKDIAGDVLRVREGQADILWPGRIQNFAVSSGTTSSGKIIPVSADMLRHNKRFSIDVALQYLSRTRNTRFLWGKHLALPGHIERDPTFPGTLIGEVSGLQSQFAPTLFRLLLQAVPKQIAFLADWEQKLQAVVERTLAMDVRMVAMAPTWAVVLFKLLLARRNELHGTRATTVGEIWPNLQLFISGGVALSSYRVILEEMIGLPDMHFLEVYGASEGFFSFQTDLSDPAMLLHLDNGVFFEFVAMDELGEEFPQRFTVATVKPGVRYAPFLTTCSGLWAYALGDVVRFTDTSPPRIVVSGRTSEMMDKYGEAVLGEDVRLAIQQACKATEARVADFHVSPHTPSAERMPFHEWLIEFEREPADVDAFANIINACLSEINRHYHIRREARAFDPPEVVVLPRGTFFSWIKATRSNIGGQTKVPRMSEERSIAEAILRVAREKGQASGAA